MAHDASSMNFVALLFFFLLAGHQVHADQVSFVREHDKLKQLFQPVTEALGKTFEVVIDEEVYEAAGAEFDGQIYRVRVSRGLLRSPKLDLDTFRMILCHEVGHLFAGAPRRNLPPEWDGVIATDGRSLLSSEGQSDYYAARGCFQMMSRNTISPPLNDVPLSIREKCETAWGERPPQVEMCLRSARAAKNFLRLTFDFPIDFDRPDLSHAGALIRDSYPARQCRLDTFVQAALCTDAPQLVWAAFDAGKSNCRTNPEAQRPNCWYVE